VGDEKRIRIGAAFARLTRLPFFITPAVDSAPARP
jgi:hypothetical protein